MKKPKLYLANNIGFSSSQRPQLDAIEKELKRLGFDTFEPFRDNNQSGAPTHSSQVLAICDADLQGIRDCDGVFAVLNGEPPDVGVAIEVGYAAALGKKIILFRDDIRVSTDSDIFPVNLMFCAGRADKDFIPLVIRSVGDIKHSYSLNCMIRKPNN